MIKFKKITIIGFGSIKHLDFKLDSPGLNVITGETGAGKTSIFSALSWCIYGKTLKNKNSVLTWKHLRGADYKGTMVELTLIKDKKLIKIIRCMDYKGRVGESKGADRLVFLVDGKEPKYTDKRDKQKAIEATLEMGFTLAKNSIIFGQRMLRLIEETGPSQKAIFDEVFNTQFINTVRENVISDISEKTKDIHKLKIQLENAEGNLSEAKESYQNLLHSEKRSLNDYKSLKTQLKGYNHTEDDLKQAKVLLDKTTREYDEFMENHRKEQADDKTGLKLNKARAKYQGKIIDYMADIKESKNLLLTYKQGTEITVYKFCPVCNAPLKPSKIKELSSKVSESKKLYEREKERLSVLESESRFYEKKLNDINKQIDELSTRKKPLVLNMEQHNSAMIRYNKLKWEMELAEEIRSKIKKLKPIIKNPVSATYLPKISKLKLEIQKTQKAIDDKVGSIEKLEWLAKEVLSDKGIKSFIFNHLLNRLNEHLEKYFAILGFKVIFHIDQGSKKKNFKITIYHGKNPVPYEDLSGGQQQLVNIVICFGLHDVVMESSPMNLIVMDEIFEGLDQERVDKVTELIYKKAGFKSIFLITHLSTFNPIGSNQITVSQKNGYSVFSR